MYLLDIIKAWIESYYIKMISHKWSYFTLTELIVVIISIVILALVALLIIALVIACYKLTTG